MMTATIATIMTITTSTIAEREPRLSLRFFILAGLSFSSPSQQVLLVRKHVYLVAKSPTDLIRQRIPPENIRRAQVVCLA